MTDLPIGQVVRFSEDGHRERLLWRLPAGQGGWFIDIDAGTAVPILRNRDEIEGLLAENLLAPDADPWLDSGLALTEARKRFRDEAWKAIHPLALA